MITEHHNRYFLHLDLDAFYAQVEQRDNPNLRGKPVGVGASTDGKGIIMSASYEARRVGIDSVMSAYEALKICPTLVCLPCCGPKYETILNNIFNIISDYVPQKCIEKYSIDECFVDLTGAGRNFSETEAISKEIKERIKTSENLTVSMGLSYNKTYAKLGTKFNKPDGFTRLEKSDREKIFPLPAKSIWGIGTRIDRRLRLLKIKTIGDLANAHPAVLKKEFGINGIVFRKMARGEDTSEIFRKQRPEKSFSHQHTLDKPVYDTGDVVSEIRRIAEYLCRKMRSKKLVGKKLILTIRYENLLYDFAESNMQEHTNDDRIVVNTAMNLFKKLFPPQKTIRARMFGMCVTDLYTDPGSYNLELYASRTPMPFHALDALKEKYGEGIIRLGLDKY
jgi:DNA polymerase-4